MSRAKKRRKERERKLENFRSRTCARRRRGRGWEAPQASCTLSRPETRPRSSRSKVGGGVVVLRSRVRKMHERLRASPEGERPPHPWGHVRTAVGASSPATSLAGRLRRIRALPRHQYHREEAPQPLSPSRRQTGQRGSGGCTERAASAEQAADRPRARYAKQYAWWRRMHPARCGKSRRRRLSTTAVRGGEDKGCPPPAPTAISGGVGGRATAKGLLSVAYDARRAIRRTLAPSESI